MTTSAVSWGHTGILGSVLFSCISVFETLGKRAMARKVRRPGVRAAFLHSDFIDGLKPDPRPLLVRK